MLKKLTLALVLSCLAVLPIGDAAVEAQVPRDTYTKGPSYVVIAYRDSARPLLFRVSFSGHINHTEHYGSKRCSWKHDARVKANVELLRSDWPIKEVVNLWRSDAGSHYRGRDGTCGRNRS